MTRTVQLLSKQAWRVQLYNYKHMMCATVQLRLLLYIQLSNSFLTGRKASVAFH